MTILGILFWVSVFTGGLMILMLLLSILGGLDFDFDLDIGSDVDTEGGGGLGILKGILSFVSVSTWVIRILLISQKSTPFSISIGIIVGLVFVYLLSKLLGFLMKQTEFNTYYIEDTINKQGKVYLKVPVDGQGIVHIIINDGMKDFKCKSSTNEEIPTGSNVLVVDINNDILVVEPIN